MPRIAFSGRARSGKTTAALYLVSQCGGQIISFADALKNELASIGIEPDRMWIHKDPTVRTLMQTYGQAMRQQDGRCWINMMWPELQNATGNIYVDDLRYPNEAEFLRNMGFKLVRLEVIGEGAPGEDEHESENALAGYDFDSIICCERGNLDGLFEALEDYQTSWT